MIHRCYYCRRLVWPWQASGWGNRFPRRFGKDWWHLRCRRAFERSKGAPFDCLTVRSHGRTLRSGMRAAMSDSRWHRFVREIRDTPADAWLGAIRAWLIIAVLVWIALALLGVIR